MAIDVVELLKCVHDFARDQAKRSELSLDLTFRDEGEKPEKDSIAPHPSRRLVVALASCEYHVRSAARLRKQVRDLFRGILQVAVHHHDPLPTALREAGGDRPMLAEIPTES